MKKEKQIRDHKVNHKITWNSEHACYQSDKDVGLLNVAHTGFIYSHTLKDALKVIEGMNKKREGIEDNELCVNSKIDNGVTFIDDIFKSMEELRNYRQANLKFTQMLWIKKRPVSDSLGEPYNQTALIIINLN